jgi:ketosteroid isomerase-like protein
MTALPPAVQRFVDAGNAFDLDALVATLAEDVLVLDDNREFVGVDATRHWLAEEVVGAHVTMTVRSARQHHATTVLQAELDGDFDKAGLPDPLVLTYYVTVEDDRVVTLVIAQVRS